MASNSDSDQLFGIQELHNPGEEADIDIVAVHSLNGNAIGSWTENGTCWLSNPDLLPKYLPKTRILAWGYNANVLPSKGRTTSSNRILQHAQTLIAQLAADREALAYSESRDSPKLVHLHNIYISTYGIIFFGTPHAGASKAHLLSVLEKLASLTLPKKVVQTDSALIRALQEDSETLQNITDQFAPLMPHFHIFFLWEQERTDLKYTRDYIVQETSAAPMLTSGDTDRSGVAADHQGMCKFKSSLDQGFRTVVAAMRRYAIEAPEVVAARHVRAADALAGRRRDEAAELVRGSVAVG